MRETKKIWMNGELVDWADATVHVGSHGLHYGSGVFEGIRAYDTAHGTAIFRLTEHMQRLASSAKLMYMDLPYSVDDLKAASWDLIGATEIPQDLGHRVVEKPLIRTDLYLADEVFMCGTAAEVTPIREVDDQVVGPPGPVTIELQQAYLDTVHGRTERWGQWLEYAPAAKTR